MSRVGSIGQQRPTRRRLGRLIVRMQSRRQGPMALPAVLLLFLLLLLAAVGQAFVLHGGQQGSQAARAHTAAPQPQTALQAIALGGGEGQQQQGRQAAQEAAAAHRLEAAAAAAAGTAQQPQAQLQQQPATRARWPQLWGRDLRSPFISVEVRPATRLEELLAVIDLRAECFAGQQGPLSVEAKLRHVKHVLARRARGAVVLVATARDLLSPFSEEVVVGSVECSTHEFEACSPFLHDHATVPKLYLTEMAVKPAFRRQGIASSLLRAVDGMASKIGAVYLCLFCETGNRGGLRLYEQAGYHSVGASPSVEAFAASLGLPAQKVYSFLYRPLRVGHGQQQEAEQEEEEYEVNFRAPRSGVGAAKGGKGPSLLPGQPGLLGRMGQRAFSWW